MFRDEIDTTCRRGPETRPDGTSLTWLQACPTHLRPGKFLVKDLFRSPQGTAPPLPEALLAGQPAGSPGHTQDRQEMTPEASSCLDFDFNRRVLFGAIPHIHHRNRKQRPGTLADDGSETFNGDIHGEAGKIQDIGE